jgi:ribulose-5-phosphate 4-epimerase/fuculose-1-phosphate aldolase
MKEDTLRGQIALIGRSLYGRELAHGSAGNISGKCEPGLTRPHLFLAYEAVFSHLLVVAQHRGPAT